MNFGQADFLHWANSADSQRGRLTQRSRSLTRRGFMVGAAGIAGAAATTSLWLPIVARADDGEGGATVAPRPIPQTVAPGAPFHVVVPGPGTEPSSITDFHGTIGLAALGGTGVGTDANGKHEDLLHDVDVRFMKGKYVGVDNHRHEATFVFV
jgi:hypothetical protein